MTISIFTFFHRYHSIRGIKKQYWETQSPLLIWYFDIKLDKKSLGTKTSRKRCLFASSFSLKLEILKKQTKRTFVNTDINKKYKFFLSEKIWQKEENLNFILFIFSCLFFLCEDSLSINYFISNLCEDFKVLIQDNTYLTSQFDESDFFSLFNFLSRI